MIGDGISSDARFCALRVELAPLDLVKLRARVHARLPRLADRRAFDAATVDVSHATLVEVGATAVVRAELVASFSRSVEPPSGDRVSGVVDLLSRVGPTERTGTA